MDTTTKDVAETLRDRVVRVVREHLATSAEITDDATLESLGADSLDKVELVMALEEEFEIMISDENADGADTIGKLVKLIRSIKSKVLA